jgi:glycosyl transferase family 25
MMPPRMDGFDALNAYFDRILMITLERATDRQALARERLAGLRFEFFTGTDKQDLDLGELERTGVYREALARRATRHRRGLRPGEIGCALSHRAIYQQIVDQGWRRALILEDDAFPYPEALSQVGATLAQLPPGWELLYLGYEHGERASAWDRAKQAAYLPLAALRLIHFTPREVLGLHAAPYSKNLRRAGKHHCTHAYAVSASGAGKLLAAQTPVAFSSDQLLVKLCITGRLEAYVAEPKLFGQDSWHGRTTAYTSS